MSFPIHGVAHMVRRALNTLDYRLMDHGERVAYLVLGMLQEEGGYTPAQLCEICYLTMFHDIGAYKTEVIDSLMDTGKLFSFEITSALNHSAYSYLFLRNFSFLREYVDAVLFHHFTYPKLLESDCIHKSLAAKLFLADRVDILLTRLTPESPQDIFERLDNPVFSPDDVALLRRLEEKRGLLNNLLHFSYLEELLSFLNTNGLSDEQEASIVEMLPYTIDFRSVNTVTHTVATVEITMTIAQLMDLSEEEQMKLHYGSLLHDIGKISISLMILEKPDKLSSLEFSMMQDHVLLSEYILKGRVSKEILQIAIRHHEKLDGSGYPYGLGADQLNRNERIVAVADIMSALMGKRSYKEPLPSEQVIAILQQQAQSGKICPEVVQLVVEHFPLIQQRVERCNRRAMERYHTMTQDFDGLLARYTAAFLS